MLAIPNYTKKLGKLQASYDTKVIKLQKYVLRYEHFVMYNNNHSWYFVIKAWRCGQSYAWRGGVHIWTFMLSRLNSFGVSTICLKKQIRIELEYFWWEGTSCLEYLLSIYVRNMTSRFVVYLFQLAPTRLIWFFEINCGDILSFKITIHNTYCFKKFILDDAWEKCTYVVTPFVALCVCANIHLLWRRGL